MNKIVMNEKSRIVLLAVFFALLAFQSAMAYDACTVTRSDDKTTVTITPSDGSNECSIKLDSTYQWHETVKNDVGGGSDAGLNTTVTIGEEVTVYLYCDDESLTGMFTGFTGIEDWSFLKQINIDNMTYLNYMFSDSSLNDDGLKVIKDWKVEHVTHFISMFGSTKITKLDDLKGWNVSSGISFSCMFSNCQELSDITGIAWDKSAQTGWDVSPDADFSYMFTYCTNLEDISSLNDWGITSNADVSGMFAGDLYITPSSPSNIKIADFSSWTFNSDNCFSMLNTVDGAAVKLNQYYDGMFATKLYVFGKHSINDLTDTDIAESQDVLVFEPYSVAVTVSGVPSGANNVYTLSGNFSDAETYFTKVSVFAGAPTYDDKKTYYKSGTNCTLTLDLTGAYAGYTAVSVTATPAGGTPTTLTGSDNVYTLSNIGSDYTIAVKLQGPAATVSWNLDGGTGTTPSLTNPHVGDKFTLPSKTEVTKTGYSLSKWNDGTKDYDPGAEYEILSTTVTLTAKYTINSHKLSYSAGEGGAGSIDPETKDYGSTVEVKAGAGVMTKTGHTFANWKRSDTGEIVQPGATFNMPDQDVTLTAQYTINSYKLTYAPGEAEPGGSVPDVEQTVAYNTQITVKGNSGNLTKTGYAFGGWKRSDTGEVVQPGSTFKMPAEDVTLTAHFGKLYTVTYAKGDAASGDVPASENIIDGITVTVAGNTGNLAKAGYVFAGWEGTINGETKTYGAGETFTMPAANVTLTAVFNEVPVTTYTLTYEKGDADSGAVPAAAAYAQDAAVTVAGNTGNLAKSGSLFSGWSDGSKTYAPGTVFAMPDHDITLTAKFTKDTAFYTLTFAKESGVSGDVPQAMKVSSGILVALPAQGDLAKTGFYFAGWSDGTTVYAAGGCYLTTSRDVTLTAVFKEVQPYQADYALSIPAAQTAKYPEAGNAQISYDPSKIQAAWVEVKVEGESVALPKNEDENGNTIFKCTDKSNPDISYPFIGWIVEKANSQQANAVDAQTRDAESTTQIYWINQTTSFPMPSYSITLRPLFSYKQYAVTFDGNGADPVTVPPTQYFYYGEFAKNLWNPLTQGAPVKEGYTFTGWKESIDGEETGNVYNYDDQFVMPEKDVKLTAQFASDSEGYTLTYQYGDAQYGYPPIAETVPAGTSVTIRGNDGGLGKEGHEFTLWSDGAVEYIPGTTIVMPEEDLFLYPVFVKVPDPLPEDEIGTYSFDEAGNKFYIQFHSYDICMNYMGDEDLCRNTSTNLYNF